MIILCGLITKSDAFHIKHIIWSIAYSGFNFLWCILNVWIFSIKTSVNTLMYKLLREQSIVNVVWSDLIDSGISLATEANNL